jgi:hypothetical protein
MNQAQVRLPSIIEEGVTTNPELKRSIDYNDRSVKKIKRGGQGGGKSRSSRKRSSKSRNLRRKSIKRHRRRTSRK